MLLRAFAALLIASWMSAAGTIHLKTRDVDTSVAGAFDSAAGAPEPVYRLHASRRHLMVEFQAPWDARLISELRARGIAAVSAIGPQALTLGISGDKSLTGLGVTWSGELRARDKLSPEIDQETAWGAGWLVAFHEDVSASEIDAVLGRNRASIVPVSGLLANQRLVHANRITLLQLAAWDEVAYIFPAAAELPGGAGARPCAGALVQGLSMAPYVTVGTGWTANTPRGLALGYVFTTLTAKVPASLVQTEIVRAMHQWMQVTNVRFGESSNAAAPATIAIEFGTAVNNDPAPFDPASSILAHTYYPAPPNPEPIAGDLHFNPAEDWHVGANTDIYTVALHELGHALGLGHTDNPGDVMYPYYRFGAQLSANDIAGVQSLYGLPGLGLPPTGGGPGQDGAPIAPTSPLSLLIQSPVNGMHTAAASTPVTGSLLNASGLAAVIWRSNTGAGVASGTSDWNTGSIPLQPGVNLITVTATDGPSQKSSSVIRIVRTGQS